ncbi:MAG: TM2 domain-containing protein [Candidatus Longimicrobiales bacterium M2_2A_002]
MNTDDPRTDREAGSHAANADRPAVDPDFAQEVLEDLYAYRRKRPEVAWLLWLFFGWAGGHRFYLERVGTGILMLLTGGGLVVWWVLDARRIRRMVRYHNIQQQRRQRDGRPPLELSFMPPLADDVLRDPPAWTARWSARPRWRRGVRLAGDILVLIVAGSALGSLSTTDGGMEGVLAITALIVVTLLGGAAGWLDRVPVAGAFLRWSHRLRLFYYYNRPGSPPALLLRGLTAPFLALFRRRAREEARLYLEVGAVFALGFMAIDLVQNVAGPMVGGTGLAALAPIRLLGVWIKEAFMTFFVIYAFATPIGAVLTLHLLTRRTHTVPRLLGGLALLFIVLGTGWIT